MAAAQNQPSTPPLELIRSGDVLALRVPSTGRVVGFHGREMQVAELQPEVWTGLFKGQNSPTLTDHEREALQDLATWKLVSTETAASPTASAASATSNVSSKARKSIAFTPPAIRSLTINVAQICNLACTYCAAGGDGTYGSKVKTPELERTREQLAMLLKQVPSGDRFTVTFLGGEPLLYPDVITSIARDARLLVAGRGIELRFDIVTNGTLVTPEIAQMLAGLRAHVTISIDGAPEDNDKARVTKSGQGSSGKILKGLEELLKVREQLSGLVAGAVFGAHNLNVVEAWEFLSKYPFTSLKFEFAAEPGDELASRRYAQGLCEVAERAFNKGGETELRRLHMFDHLFRTLDTQTRIQNHCLAGRGHLQVDTDGKFTACQWFVGQNDELLGEDLNLDLTASNKLLANFTAPLIETNGCGTCWARHICGGGCMHVHKVKTGNKHKVDHAFCERTRTILAKGIERYAEARYQSESEERGETSEVY